MFKRIMVVALIICALATPAFANYDFGGETVTLAQSMWFGEYFSFITREDFSLPRYAGHKEDVEAMFNTYLEFDLSHAGWPADASVEYLLPRVIAGEGNFVTVTTSTVIPILVANNLIMPLTEWVNEDYFARLPRPLSALPNFVSFLGDTWAFQFGPRMVTEANVVMWNKDLFDELGLPSPYDLYEAGEWTWEAFYDLAVKLTRDTDGDGEIDQWGVATRHSHSHWGGHVEWVYTNGGALTREIDGKIVFTLDEPEALEALEFWQRAYQANIWSPDQWHYEFAAGNVAMLYDFADSISYLKDSDVNFGLVPAPKGPRADRHVAIESGRWVAILPITAQNPEALIEVWHALYELATPYIDDLERWEEDFYSDVSLLLRDYESLEYFMWVTENAEGVALLDVVGQVPGFGDVINEIVMEGRDAASAIAEIKPAVQAYLDEVFDQ
ncbi:MAG: extracellular solute-binding protein [Firmicutes bacterium]|nr:extracellular solute-binding protein [Bacillota bacterium]